MINSKHTRFPKRLNIKICVQGGRIAKLVYLPIAKCWNVMRWIWPFSLDEDCKLSLMCVHPSSPTKDGEVEWPIHPDKKKWPRKGPVWPLLRWCIGTSWHNPPALGSDNVEDNEDVMVEWWKYIWNIMRHISHKYDIWVCLNCTCSPNGKFLQGKWW